MFLDIYILQGSVVT